MASSSLWRRRRRSSFQGKGGSSYPRHLGDAAPVQRRGEALLLPDLVRCAVTAPGFVGLVVSSWRAATVSTYVHYATGQGDAFHYRTTPRDPTVLVSQGNLIGCPIAVSDRSCGFPHFPEKQAPPGAPFADMWRLFAAMSSVRDGFRPPMCLPAPHCCSGRNVPGFGVVWCLTERFRERASCRVTFGAGRPTEGPGTQKPSSRTDPLFHPPTVSRHGMYPNVERSEPLAVVVFATG